MFPTLALIKLQLGSAERFFDIWAEDSKPSVKESDAEAPQIWKGDRIPNLGKGLRPTIPAVVVDAPGCSFNPDPVQHKVFATFSCFIRGLAFCQEMLTKKKVQEANRAKKSVTDVYAQESLVDEMQQFMVMI